MEDSAGNIKKTPFCGELPESVAEVVSAGGYDQTYAYRLAMNFYRRRIHDFLKMENIPLALRRLVCGKYSSGIFPPVCESESYDGSRKYLFRSPDRKEYETVFIPDGKRMTVCVSSQSGCRMGCTFCLTSRVGYRGNLSAGEIVNQVLSVPSSGKITHVVFMGMGEPLDNTHNVIKACKILTAEWGLAMSPLNITVSTTGITSEVRYFLENSACNLTLSLFSPFSGERASLCPCEKKYPASEVVEIMKGFSSRKKRRFSIAYVMIEGLNDSRRHAEGLQNLLAGSGIRVNLIPYNKTGFDDRLSPSPESAIRKFREILAGSGISASVRKPRGSDISAACGLLAFNSKKNFPDMPDYFKFENDFR